MARIELDLAHAYKDNPQRDEDFALLPLKMTFADGGAYALLGPSGCGKTTMLNIISGLVTPSRGRVLFDGKDVTALTPQQRNIAQVFQFPVIYDTMTVAENLAFPLKNRGVAPARIKERVGQIAEMLELSAQLDQRAAGLAADAKQKISLGRGLVREDVSAVLFDEPLTVIDPHLKWQLRRKLKQIHHELKLTLVYVTHDQVEALTFAEQVLVMTRGRTVQVGSASDLFERPQHTFVGHFIGSPGMNFLPARAVAGGIEVAGHRLATPRGGLPAAEAFTLGVQRSEVGADSLRVSPTPNVRQTYYWRVRGINPGGDGPLSDVRRFTAYGPYEPRVEDVQEWDAAGPVATDADGSAADPSLLNSENSTRTRPPTYSVGAFGAPSNDPAAVVARLDFGGLLLANAPREYELRWVDAATQGQVILNRGWDRTDPARAFLTCVETGAVVANAYPTSLVSTPAPVVRGYPRMPFQAWEIESDGTERQVHANVLDDDADMCYSFTTPANSGAAPLAGGGYERLYVSRVPYVESELANPADVHTRANVQGAASQAFGRMTILPRTSPARPPQAGTRIRIVTSDDYTTAAEGPPASAAGIEIGAARPNPVHSRAAVRFTTGTVGTVRLSLYDVLGRRVAVLAEGERPAGQHEATLDARRLAPGVYLLVLESGGARAVRPVTVVR